MNMVDKQILTGGTMLAAFLWRNGEHCKCCGAEQSVPREKMGKDRDIAFVLVRTIQWGDDWTDTIEESIPLCRTCWSDKNALCAFLRSNGYRINCD